LKTKESGVGGKKKNNKIPKLNNTGILQPPRLDGVKKKNQKGQERGENPKKWGKATKRGGPPRSSNLPRSNWVQKRASGTVGRFGEANPQGKQESK